ncbi:hypothetical protein AMECASPLE_008879 [Ameca splendens]|uniref:Uncharacterized protein n=1 Tax=Ameca splendens TaxID=208324 RepID=A0ABV0YM59_9TELE
MILPSAVVPAARYHFPVKPTTESGALGCFMSALSPTSSANNRSSSGLKCGSLRSEPTGEVGSWFCESVQLGRKTQEPGVRGKQDEQQSIRQPDNEGTENMDLKYNPGHEKQGQNQRQDEDQVDSNPQREINDFAPRRKTKHTRT